MTYITENIIAMGFPAGDMSSGFFGYVEVKIAHNLGYFPLIQLFQNCIFLTYKMNDTGVLPKSHGGSDKIFRDSS